MPAQESPSTVYIVDDHAETVRSLTQLLRAVSLQTETFSSASAFLQRSEEPLHGCLILDLLMPEMNGLELLSRLRERRIEVPAIMISAYGDVPSAVQAMRLGALDFILKPFSIQALINRVQEAMRLSANMRAERKEREALLAAARAMTPREREVMKLMLSGRNSKDIARHLRISSKTVDVHRMHIMRKMGTESITLLVIMGMKIMNYL